jgi:Sulfotransferase domain
MSRPSAARPPTARGVLAAYRRRTEEVCAAIAAERLLVFNVAEGWAPLCRFLDVPVPNASFPRMNSTEQFWKTVPLNSAALPQSR